MTQEYRWLAAFALLLAFSACTVRAEEEEEAPPPHRIVELLPPPHEAPMDLPYVPATPLVPALTWPLQFAARCPCPCPCPCPMPAAPVAAFVPYGQPCPVCPAGAYACPKCTDPPEYMVSLRLCKAGCDGGQDVLTQPTMVVADGQTGTMELNGCATPREQSSVRMQVTVTKHGDDAFLALAVQDVHFINGRDSDARAHTEATETHCKVALGASTKMVLNENADGSPRTWVELKVTEHGQNGVKAACAGACSTTERLEEEDADDSIAGSFSDVVQNVFEFVADTAADLFGADTWSDPPTLPSGQYFMHPPQYFPAEPVFPVARELPTQIACPGAATGCGKAGATTAVGQCDTPAAGCGSGVRQCSVTEAVKQPAMRFCIDGCGERKCLDVAGGKQHIKAWADRITVHGDCILLQGDARLESCDDSCDGSTLIKAGVIRLERKDAGVMIHVEE
jgi:hypothetical protein